MMPFFIYKKYLIWFFTLIVLSVNSQYNSITVNPKGNTVGTRFLLPEGFLRTHAQENSFAYFLKNFKLKEPNSKVYLYNGKEKNRQDVHIAVLDIDIGKKDLQQCADAVIRLRAEYLYKTNQFEKINFSFTSGFKAEYKKWMMGYRISVKNNAVKWYLKGKPDNSVSSFNEYLKTVFLYAGTLSLSKELKRKSVNEIEAGDVFIEGGSPGHAVIVMDVAINKKTNQRIFILAQSYMPAQNIHILKNQNNSGYSPWYMIKENESLITPEWTFKSNSLYSFE